MTERERDLERFLTFVDAIVAIAITLLVLPLVEVGAEVGAGSVPDLLAEHRIDILGFLLSFTVIARLWLAQHHVVRSLVRQSRPVVVLLLGWTLTIVFLPFPTALGISVAFPAASYWPLLVLVLTDPVVDRIRRRTRVGTRA